MQNLALVFVKLNTFLKKCFLFKLNCFVLICFGRGRVLLSFSLLVFHRKEDSVFQVS